MLAAALWWGSLSALFVMVPLLFANLPSHAVAGNAAAHLFTAQSWISIGCAMLLLVLSRAEEAPEAQRAHGLLFFVLLGLLLALLVEYAVAPHIVARDHLKFWHPLGSLMLLAQWACALTVLWRLPGSAAPGPASPPG